MHSDDPAADDPVPSPPHPFSYVTIRLTADEFERVARAARAGGLSVPEYARQAVIHTADREA